MKPLIIAGTLGLTVAFFGSVALFNWNQWCDRKASPQVTTTNRILNAIAIGDGVVVTNDFEFAVRGGKRIYRTTMSPEEYDTISRVIGRAMQEGDPSYFLIGGGRSNWVVAESDTHRIVGVTNFVIGGRPE